MKDKKITWKSGHMNVKDLTPFEGNPRQANEKEVKDLKRSLDKFGLAEPLVVNTDAKHTVIGGNFRLRMQIERGVTAVDVMYPSRTLNRTEADELNLRLNTNQGQWDFGVLANFYADML